MSELIELHINQVKELSLNDGIELIGNEIAWAQEDTGLLVYHDHVVLARETILEDEDLYRLIVYLINDVTLSLRFDSQELLNKAYTLLK